jgi:hypothetical protein
MNRTASNQSLVFSLLLTVSPFAICTAGATEHEIHDEHVKQALAALTKQDTEATKATAELTAPTVDLSKVNSSTEQPAVNFGAIKSSISRIEYELADLKVHLKDMEESVALQEQDEKNLRARLKAELERKVAAPAAEIAETGDDEATDESVEDVLEEDDIDIDDEDQDAVAIIAKECE